VFAYVTFHERQNRFCLRFVLVIFLQSGHIYGFISRTSNVLEVGSVLAEVQRCVLYCPVNDVSSFLLCNLEAKKKNDAQYVPKCTAETSSSPSHSLFWLENMHVPYNFASDSYTLMRMSVSIFKEVLSVGVVSHGA
jgi:hypothetical protein